MRALAWRLVLVLVLLAGAAWAQAPFVPGLYRVAGVAVGDVLNVRAAPQGSAEVLEGLPPDTAGVEVIALDASGAWGKIAATERNGWVAMRYLEAMPIPPGDVPQRMTCSGTEPFWTLVFGATTVDYLAPDAAWKDLPLLGAGTQYVPEGQVYGFVATGGSGSFSGIIRPEHCTDGMSDRDFGWSVRLLRQDGDSLWIEQGCCSLDLR